MAPKKQGYKHAANGKQRKQSSKEGSRLSNDTRQEQDTENANNTTAQQTASQNDQHVNGLDNHPVTDFRSLQNEIELMRQQLDAARAANRQLRENSISRMQEVFQICEEKVKVQDQKMMEMTQVCRNQNQMMNEFFKENQTLKEELNQSKEELNQSKQLLESLQQEKIQSDEHVNSLETLNKNLQQQQLDAQQQCNQMEKEFQEFEQQYQDDLKDKTQQYSLQLQERDSRILCLHNQIDQLTAEKDSKIACLENQIDQLTTELKKLKGTVSDQYEDNNLGGRESGSRSQIEHPGVITTGLQQYYTTTGLQQYQTAQKQQQLEQNQEDSINKGSSNKENTPVQHENKAQPTHYDNFTAVEKDSGTDTNIRLQYQDVEENQVPLKLTQDENYIQFLETQDEIMALENNGMEIQNGIMENGRQSEISDKSHQIFFDEFDFKQMDSFTCRYYRQDLGLEFEIKTISSKGQKKFRFRWIKRGDVVPRFLEHSLEFTEDMSDKFRAKILSKIIPYISTEDIKK